MEPKCKLCNDSGWVDESDLTVEWTGAPDQGAGQNCVCNPDGHYEFAVVYASVDDATTLH